MNHGRDDDSSAEERRLVVAETVVRVAAEEYRYLYTGMELRDTGTGKTCAKSAQTALQCQTPAFFSPSDQGPVDYFTTVKKRPAGTSLSFTCMRDPAVCRMT